MMLLPTPCRVTEVTAIPPSGKYCKSFAHDRRHSRVRVLHQNSESLWGTGRERIRRPVSRQIAIFLLPGMRCDLCDPAGCAQGPLS